MWLQQDMNFTEDEAITVLMLIGLGVDEIDAFCKDPGSAFWTLLDGKSDVLC